MKHNLATLAVPGWLAAILGLAVVCPVRADNLDEALIKQSKKIMAELRTQEYKNVGVLKFKLERQDGKATYDAGLINANLANRLENALILANDVDAPIGITRGAGNIAAQAAARSEVLDPSTAEGRASLFKLEYPLAWGDAKVKVDAFLTGVIKLSDDRTETTVTVQTFDAKNSKDMRTLATLTVPTDRSILSDLGNSFIIRRSINNSDDTQDKEAIDSAASLDKQKPKAVNTNNTAVSELVELKVFYDNEPVEFSGNPANLGAVKLTEPRANQKIHFALKNKSGKKLAAAVRVNGRNTTVDEEDNLQPIEYTRWVLEPGKEYVIRGFYSKDGKSVKAFTVLPDDVALKQATLHPATRGLIQMDIFAEGAKREDSGLFSARNISLRAGAAKAEDHPKTLADARKQTMLATVNRKVLPSSKGLIAPGSADATNVQSTTFDNPTQIGSLIVRYYTAE